ncbi:MAG: thermonuclease family protein [Hyphomicrobiaceae bacterium]|nr:thermonuclease family protein [Hyphomicrobiaceae bacterium]
MGILKVEGTIALDQFWPTGESDADTTKIHVNVSGDSFIYAADGQNFVVTHVFDGARVVGKSNDLVIENGRITVRLQGVDAPELHYRAAALPRTSPATPGQRAAFNQANRTSRRQHWAESATLALKDRLSLVDPQTVPCQVLSFVDHPYELVDTYGRVVGNIRIGRQFETDINLWLTEEAWVVPTFYSSMTEDEIEALLEAMRRGFGKGRVLDAISSDTSAFDDRLVYRRNGPAHPGADAGPVLMPKVFRRQVAYELQKKTGIVSGTFKAFLSDSPDFCFELEDFLRSTVHSATPRRLHDFVTGSRLRVAPHEIVFKEKFSSVVDADGRRLDAF